MTGVSTLGQSLNLIERLTGQQRQLDDLASQLTTGRITQKFTGLKADVLNSKRARADLSALETYTQNIKNSDRRIKLTLNAIEEFKAQAENFANALLSFTQQGAHQQGDIVYYDDPLTPEVENTRIGYSSAEPDVPLETLKDLAASVFDFMRDLLNAKDGNRYLLSGSDTNTAPIPDTSILESAVGTQLAGFKSGTITSTELIANLRDRTVANGNADAFTDTVIGYSSALSAGTAGKVYVRVDEKSEIDYTVLGNDSGFRDIMVAVSYFKSEQLGPVVDHVEIDPNTGLPNVITEGSPGADIDEQEANFYEVMRALAATVTEAIDDIDQQRFKLESARARIDSVRQSHAEQQNILQDTIDDVENADINDVAVRLQSLQIQLEASFRVSARVQELSLINFI